MSKYLIQYEEIKHLDNDNNPKEIADFVKSIPGKKLNELSLKDFVYHDGEPIYRGVGVYIFKSEERNYYVGSCVARSFIERVPAHLDIRKVGWFNSLLKHILLAEGLGIEKDESYEAAAQIAFEKISLVLINFKYVTDEYGVFRNRITNLERRIGKSIAPYNTSFPRIKDVPDFDTIPSTSLK